jgi:putative heme-binding domain-containing protein
LTAKGRPLVERPKLAAMKTSELLDQLDLRRSPEDYTRAMARRVLIEKGPAEVLPALKNWVNGMSVNDEKVDRTHEQLEALWLYQALNEVEPALLKQMLTVRDARARAAATRVLRDWHPRIPNALELLATLIHDESPRVRLEAICALEAIPDLRSLEIALRALDMPRDANIDFALYHACNTLKAQWLPGVENGSYTFGGNVHALSFALQSVGSKAGVGPLLKLLKEDKIARENREDVVGLITGMGGPPELSALMQIQRDARSNNLRAIIFTALARAASERNIRPQDTKSPAVLRMLEQYLQNATPPLDPEVCAAAARLAGAWKLDELREPLERMANTTLAPAVQLAVMDALTALGTHPRTLEILTRLLYQGAPAVVARAAVKLLALDKPDAVNFAANVLKNPLGNSAQEIFAAYSKKEDVAKQLVAALQVKGIAPENADAGLRYFNASGQNSPELIQFLKTTIQAQAAGASNSPQVAGKKPSELSAVMLADEKKSLAAADMQALIADVQQHGDPARGEKIFRRGTLSCFSCHAIGGAGGQVGPDLSSVGAASQLDYVIDSVLSPNKNVKEGYNSLTVVTKNREVFTGNMVRQTATHLILRDGMRDEIPIPVGEVLRKRESGSLMPSGLADSLTRGELVDLIRFLSELGKPGPFSTAQSTAIRRFRTLDPVPPEIMFENPAAVPAVLAKASNLTWLPFYPTASGAVPHADLLTGKNRYIAFLRFELNVLTPGKISLRVRSPGIVNLWLNDAVLDPNASVVDVPKGLCQFTLRVDKHVKPDIGPNDGLKVEVEELAGSPARFQRVVGK